MNAHDRATEAIAAIDKLLAATEGRTPLPCPEIALPPGWRYLTRNEFGFFCYNGPRELKVGVSEAKERDGCRWRHVSASKPKRVPNYEEMCLVKNIFVGEEVEAYQVGAPKSRHVSIHPNCLHWWAPMDGPVLPDFSSGGLAI